MSRSAVETHLQPGRQISGTPAKDIFTRMQELHVPNASVTVINGGVVEWSHNYSAESQSAEEVPVEPVFQAGSISKTVNAVLAMKLLVETGIIGLNDNLTAQLNAMGIVNNTGKPITLAQLLSHTAGISKPGFGFLGYHSSGKDFPTTAQILAGNPALKGLKSPAIDLETHNTNTNTAPIEVVSEPGKECAYSGGGTTIIQKLIEDLYCAPGSNETYASLAKKHIFDPLGMTQSSFEFKVPGTTGAEVQKGHHKNGDVIPGNWRMFPELGAGGLWTTSKDLAKFMIAMQDAYLGKPNSLLSTETARPMLTRQPDPGYELCLMSDDPSAKLEPNKLYIAFDAQNQTLMYSVLTPEGIEVRNKPLLNYAGSIPDPLTTEAVASLDKTKILESTSKSGDTRYFRFGLGFAVHGEGDAIAFCHDGATIGFQADFICFPNKGMGAIVMTNSDNGFRLMREIFSSLAHNYDYPELKTKFEDVVRLDDKILQRCAGEFVNSADKNVLFISKIVDGQLKMSLPDFGREKLKELTFVPLSPTTFFCVEHQFEVTFDADYKGMTFGDGTCSKRNDMLVADQTAHVLEDAVVDAERAARDSASVAVLKQGAGFISENTAIQRADQSEVVVDPTDTQRSAAAAQQADDSKKMAPGK